MVIKNVKVFRENGVFEDGEIYVDGGIIAEADGRTQKFASDREVVDGEGCYAIPGLTDIHFHGCMGYDFCAGTNEAVEAIAAYEASQGITTICPATLTLSEEQLTKISETAKNYENRHGAVLCGINMEGPFICKEKKGAQNEAYIHKPDAAMFLRLQEAAGGLYKLVDIAPETEGAMEFIDEVKDKVTVSIAHTTADYETAKKAIEHGARHVTHLYNAMPPLHHRNPGVIGAACENDNVYVELICDGIHIHPATVRATFKMFGDDRIVMISDSLEASGMPDGDYQIGGLKAHLKGKWITLDDGTIAGSATNLMGCVRTAVKEMGIPLESAVKCAAVNSAKAIGVYDKYGSITPGKAANIVLLDKELNVKAVYINGKKYTA